MHRPIYCIWEGHTNGFDVDYIAFQVPFSD
eukprot:SAG11_NODE_22482_length_405_cov_1.000000_1_plen_29_part_01